MSDTIWLPLYEGEDDRVSIGIGRTEAMSMSKRDLARMYRRHVYGASRRQAREWARRQVAERSGVAASTAPGGVPGEETPA